MPDMQNTNTSQVEIKTPTVQSNEIVIDATKDNEIVALKNRVAAIENYLKKLSESYVMNQL